MKPPLFQLKGARWLSLLSAVLLLSCQGSLLSFRGETVPPGNRIALTQGTHSGAWDAYDLRISYRYTLASGRLRLSGVIIPANHLRYNFLTLDHLLLRVHFLDGQGRVIESIPFMVGRFRQEMQDVSFQKAFGVPADSRTFTFSYSGTAVSSDNDSGLTTWDFWDTPASP